MPMRDKSEAKFHAQFHHKTENKRGKDWGMVDNLEYSNFENFKTPNRSLCWEISSPLSAYSH